MSTQAIRFPTWPEGFALVPQIDRNPGVVSFAQTIPGKLVIIACATMLLYARGILQPGIVVILAGISLLPEYRWLLMAIGGVCWLPRLVNWHMVDSMAKRVGAGEIGFVVKIGSTATALAICAFLWLVIRRWPNGIVARNPRLTLLAVFAAAVASARVASGPLTVPLWGLVASLSASIWFFSYILTESPSGRPLWHSGAILFSLWSVVASSTPFLPRPSAMRKAEAKTAEEFAIVQLKGLKLLAWALILAVASAEFDAALAKLSIPPIPEAIAASSAGHPYQWHLCWMALLGGFAGSVLSMAAWGNTIVAGCRLAGFHLLRNTYRPLESRTVADFWNRYYFYYKELIVDFFFYPVYLRCFKKHPRVRMLFATWVAVGLGIPLFHFVRDIDYVAELGLAKAVIGFHVFLFYGMVLSVAIGISQLRKATGHSRTLSGRFLPTTGVVLLFCFLQVFQELGRTTPIREHFLFLTRLVGWRG